MIKKIIAFGLMLALSGPLSVASDKGHCSVPPPQTTHLQPSVKLSRAAPAGTKGGMMVSTVHEIVLGI
ncbi:MAG TPA: hypothetical protein VFS31_00050 [Chitinophagaceae bacterium]|jgi:hypothetical protein|nr:hypothetical protein [Chitinophagaceae bacterium]